MVERREGPALLVITGPPGAGKSTVSALVAHACERSVLIEGDAFFAFLDQGAIPPWLPESHAQNDVVVRAAAAAAGRFGEAFFTVYDGVLGSWFLPAFASVTGLDVLHYVTLLPSVERCIERVATRTGHGFRDEAATRKMHDEFRGNPIDPATSSSTRRRGRTRSQLRSSIGSNVACSRTSPPRLPRP